jgi:predicted transcriptional regulator
MKHRSRLEIIALILEIANGTNNGDAKATQQKIMYKAYLSYSHLKSYLLMENNLLEYFADSRIYKTTDKGVYFLKIYRDLTEVVAMTNNIIMR